MRYILAFLIICLLSSCQDSNSTLESNKYVLVENGVKRFPLDKSTSYNFIHLNTIIDQSDQEILVALNRTKPSILFYNIGNENLVNEILLQKTGPDGVGDVYGLYIKSSDSIYVVSPYEYKIRLINSQSKVLQIYRLLNNDKYNESTGLIAPYTKSLPVRIKDHLYFSTIPDRNPFEPNFFDGYINLEFDMNTGKFRYFNSFPNELKNNIWGSAAMDYSFTLGPDQSSFIYSFDFSDSLLVYNIEEEQKYRVNAKSIHKQKKSEPMKASVSNSNMTERLRYNFNATHYNGIVYDNFNEVYYRFVLHSYPYKDSNDEINQIHEKPISVIILDKNYEIIGETKLADKTFVNWIYFVSSDGLCIANANPENPNLEEDFAVFTCFKLNKK